MKTKNCLFCLFLIVFLAIVSKITFAVPNGLVAAYSFDEGTGTTVADVSGNNNNGIISGASWTTGKFGNALSFDGVNDWVTVNDANSLDLINKMTLEAWVYPTVAPSGWRTTVAKEGSGTVVAYFLHASSSPNNRPATGVTIGGVEQQLKGGSQLAVNTWTHLAATYNGSVQRLYVNGVQVGSRLQTGSITTTTNPLRIGGNNIWGEYFQGRIDEVRVYNRSLTQAEIQNDMNTPVNPPTPKLIIITPLEGAVIPGTTVNVTYTTQGNLSGVDHIHFQLDNNPEVMEFGFDGFYQFTNVPAGLHILKGYLTRADHSKINNTNDSVSFTTTVPDTIPPVVSITSPSNNSIVNGTIIVFANASDNVGIAGVQFKVDGINIGAEDTTAPYSISWNTATVTNGIHILTAVARDASGNTATSSPVTISVSNALPPGPSDIGQWQGPFTWPIAPVHMVLQPTGQVIIWDELNGGLAARIWNPKNNSFTPIPNTQTNLFCAGHSGLGDGRSIVIGGHAGVNFFGLVDTNIYNPQTQTWTKVANMNFARWYPTSTTLPDGRVLAISGWITPTQLADIPEVYNPATNTWTALTTAQLQVPMYSFMFVLPDGTVFNAGPGVVNGIGNTMTRKLNITSQTWTNVGDSFITGHSAVMYAPGKIMKSGTIGDPDFPLPSVNARTVVIDMNQVTPSWTETAQMAFPRAYHNLVLLPDGKVLVVGGERTASGQNTAQAVYAAELWNPVNKTWTTMASMQRARLYHSTALLLPDARVLVSGGEFLPYIEENAEIYSPPYLFKGPRPSITSAPVLIQYVTQFLVETPNAVNISSVALIRNGAVTHGFDQNQRYVPLNFSQTVNGINVQSPANANLAPPGYYMLFIVNINGVPSNATFVRLPSPLEDLQPPLVSITSPLNGSTVNGTIAITANASDNVGVVGVQFKVDNISIGIEDTSPPYSILWNTTTVANGLHVLTAVARDAAGNTATSAGIMVNASNPIDTIPPVISGVSATSITTNSANIIWTTNEPADSMVEYGLTPSYGNQTPLNPSLVTSHLVTLTGILANTTYHYRVKSKDASSNLAISPDFNFTTLASVPTPTVVTFDNPVPPGSSGSLLNGVFQGIDFGTGQWRWEGPYGADTTNHIFFDSSIGTSRTFSFSLAPKVLNSMRVFTGVTGTLTLSDNIGQTKTQTITTGSMQLVTTGWTQPSTTITVSFTAGWELGVDDITYT